jgi:hypothetical protein
VWIDIFVLMATPLCLVCIYRCIWLELVARHKEMEQSISLQLSSLHRKTERSTSLESTSHIMTMGRSSSLGSKSFNLEPVNPKSDRKHNMEPNPRAMESPETSSSTMKREHRDIIIQCTQTERLIVKRAVAICSAFTIVWVCVLFIFAYSTTTGKEVSFAVDAIGAVLAQSNTLFNPIIYFCVDSRFSDSLFEMLGLANCLGDGST